MQLDIGWLDLLAGIKYCLSPARLPDRYREVEQLWTDADDGFAHLSVRSGFDLLLQELDWPSGSELILSAANITDMADIVTKHGLIPVPVDLELKTMQPQRERLAPLITSRTRAIMIAHLFGGRVDLQPAAELAAEHGLLLIEDCAQAFDGSDYRGDPGATVSMFSFGTIKTATALGGALFSVRDPRLLSRLRAARARQSPLPNAYLGRKILRMALLKFGSSPRVFPLYMWLLRLLKSDPDVALNASVRGFGGGELFEGIRRQAPPAVLALMIRRIKGCRSSDYDRRRLLGALVASASLRNVTLLGSQAAKHSHWVLPVVCEDPDSVVEVLQSHGFDATRSVTSLGCIPAVNGCPGPMEVQRAFENIVYLPVSNTANPETFAEMIRVLGGEVPAGAHFP
jgi:dTDP-4-amino-4,6-dideoxygalactose transaminase